MANADDLLRDGDLDGARAALVEIVRSQPSDVEARMFLFQLLTITGELEKASKQLQALAQLSPEAQMLSVAYGQAIEAENIRKQVFAGEIPMPILVGEDGWAKGLAEGLTLIAKGEVEAGIEARNAAFDEVPDCPGSLNGEKFEWLADADSRFGPCLEAMIAGRYGIIPFDVLDSVKSEGVQDLRDVIWYPVQLAMRSGQSIAAMLPARYPGSEDSEDNNEKLAHTTAWREAPWGEVGRGQRLLSLSSGEEYGLLSVTSLIFD